MNWHIETTADQVKKAKPDLEHAEHEDDGATPEAKLITAARNAGAKLAAELGGDQHLVTIDGHETTEGDGFKPGHVTVTVSRVDAASAQD